MLGVPTPDEADPTSGRYAFGPACAFSIDAPPGAPQNPAILGTRDRFGTTGRRGPMGEGPMPAFHPRIRALAVGAAALALVAIGVGGTVAASNPATLYACYDVYGNVRMSDTAQCKLPGGGRLASWGTAAVPGPTGPTGATGAQGPSGPIGPTGAPYAPTLVEWDFTVPTCEPGPVICPATSTTTFPAGTRLTPVSGEIDSVTGSGVATCLSTILKVDTGDSNYLFSQQFDPAGALPKAIGTVAARTLTTGSSLRAFATICGTASVQRPSISGKLILQVEYPPVVIP